MTSPEARQRPPEQHKSTRANRARSVLRAIRQSLERTPVEQQVQKLRLEFKFAAEDVEPTRKKGDSDFHLEPLPRLKDGFYRKEHRNSVTNADVVLRVSNPRRDGLYMTSYCSDSAATGTTVYEATQDETGEVYAVRSADLYSDELALVAFRHSVDQLRGMTP